jgi:hypothetical protein
MAVSAAFVLVAGTALLIPARAAWTAHASPRRATAGHPRSTRTARPEPSAHQRTPPARQPASPPPRTIGPDARLAAALAPLLRQNPGRLAAGITNQVTGFTATYHSTMAFDTASIIKADILAVLLLQHQQVGTALSAGEQQFAAQMIEDSSNAAATALWDAVGGAPGMQAGNAALGLRGIVPDQDGYWGLTTTTVTGQLGLLTDLTSARSPLSAPARHYELSLMQNTGPGQDWGVTAAASAGTRPAVKNGWLPDGPHGTWVVNSIGVISHAGQQLTIVILSDGQPSESAGISRVQAVTWAAITAATTSPRFQAAEKTWSQQTGPGEGAALKPGS